MDKKNDADFTIAVLTVWFGFIDLFMIFVIAYRYFYG